MAEFGWAYVVGTQTRGPSGSLQLANDGVLSGSSNLVYNSTSSALSLTGTLNVSGAINANELNINVTNKNVINLTATGSTNFGDDCADKHVFTGSMLISCSSTPLNIIGLQSAPASSSNHYLALDSNYNLVLTSAATSGGGLIDEYTNPGNNRIITSIDGSGINAEANLLFDGSILTVTGSVLSTGDVSASRGQFTQMTGTNIQSTNIQGTTVTSTTVNATNLGGTLTTTAQPNVVSLGTLTSLNVSGDITSSALFVSSSSKRVGIGTDSPAKKLEVLDTSEQLRLSYSKYIFGSSSNVHTDIFTTNAGNLILSSSNNRVGIGTSSPTAMLDVAGNVNVSGNLTVTGSLHAKVSEFVVSANNITFGDAATDSLTFNASSGTVPNGLNLDSNTWVLDSVNNRIGIGAEHPETSLHIKNGSAGAVTAVNNTVLVLESNEKPRLQFQSPGAYGGTIVFGSPTDNDEGQIDYDHGSDRFLFKTGGNTKFSILGDNVGVGTASPQKKLHVVGNTIITQNLGVTGSITGSSLTDGTAVMTGGNISSVGTLTATTVNATNLGGTLTTAAQPNVTSVGTLTSLEVAGDLTVDTDVLKVNSTTNKVGIGRTDPVRKLDVLSTDPQLRLAYSKYVFGASNDVHSDLYTTSNGHLILSASSQRVGIGTDSPTRMLDVNGHMRVSGNLEITGSLHAKVSEFIVSANNITFGNSATDTLIFNAASGTIMNGLNLDGGTFVIDSDNDRVGVGVAAPLSKLHVSSTSMNQLQLSNNANNAKFKVDSSGDLSIENTGNFITASAGFKVSGSTVLGSLASHSTTVSGQLTAAVSVSSSIGRFGQLTGSSITDGTAVMTGGNISSVGTLTATNLGGTLSTAAQPNITSVGTLSSLSVAGDLTVDTNTLKVDSTNNRVGIGVIDPQKPLEISSSSGGLRLTYSRFVFGSSALVKSDLSTDSAGRLVLESSGNKVKVVGGMEITGLGSGTGASTSHYLALDSSNNIVLTSSTAPAIETRNRRVITSDSTLSSSDYYIGISASSDIILDLPSAAVLENGQTFTIKDEKGNANSIEVKIKASGSQKIDGESFVIIESPFGALNLYTDGVSKYFIF